MRRRAWAGARLLGGVAILAVLVWRLGTGPFLDGLRGLRPATLLCAVAIGLVTTVCSAWRWRAVAAALGLGLPLPAATYYRSQLLNSALPGGVLGDVHRGLRHGADAGDLGHGVRAVVWERTGGQVVQVAIAVGVLLVLPSPLRSAVPPAAAVVAVAGFVFFRLAAEARRALLGPATWPAVLLASVLVVGGHLAMFLLAARAAGVRVPPAQLLPLALIVLLAAAVPVNIGGWGPREGVSAWVFAAAGVGVGAGAAVATAFGVLTLVSVLPGAAVLLVRRRPAPRPPRPAPRPEAVPAHG